MRFVVYGAGAIGGVLAGRLVEHGHDAAVIARGAHLNAIRAHGLTVQSPDGAATVRLEAVGHPRDAVIGEDDVVVLAMKSQDTVAALDALAGAVPPTVAVVCAQNGVENERAALRRFERVYGMCVMCPATHLEPGVVQAEPTPVTGLMDVGRWPSGRDAVTDAVAAALSSATFASEPREDIARWKWGKLLMNLGNALEAVVAPDERLGALVARARDEGVACLAAAGIAFVGPDEDARRRGALLTPRPIGDQRRGGGSTWQSLTRSLGSVETDYLTGEVVLLGRLHGVPTPLNALLQRLANDLARRRAPPGSIGVDEVLGMLGERGE